MSNTEAKSHIAALTKLHARHYDSALDIEQQKTADLALLADAFHIHPEVVQLEAFLSQDDRLEDIDHLARMCDNAKYLGELVSALDKRCKDHAVTLTKKHGLPKPGTKTAWELAGVRNTLTVSVGTSTEIKEDEIAAMQKYLDQADHHSTITLFGKLFTRRVTHQIAEGATEALQDAFTCMPKAIRARIERMWSRCFKRDDKAPSLKVKIGRPAPAKKSRAKKAA